MQTYRFTCTYESGYGTWQAGDTADFDDITAAWLLRDVPGCIVVVGDETTAADELEQARDLSAPEHDRQMKRAPRKR